MKILQVHNFYQAPGGEDQVCAAEYELLASRGQQVEQYFAQNDAIREMSGIRVGLKTIWNSGMYTSFRSLIARIRPDILHVHNTFPLISPAVYYAAAAERVPVVQTLHNYRLLCPAATFFRQGRICEECLHARVPYQSVLHACYRHNRPATAAAASMLITHRILGTWKTKVGTYIALTNFSKSKFVEGGLPADRIAVKPNCLINDPGVGAGDGEYALFAGRLADEKGVRPMLNAWQRLGSAIQLRIAGDGPLQGWVKDRIAELPPAARANVQWLGHCNRDTLTELYQHAAFTIFPSQYYEALPMTIIESLACGTPVIASGLGSMNEIITDGVNGFHFRPGDQDDLVHRVQAAFARPDQLQAMRRSARLCFEQNYTPERNYGLLMQIYQKAMQNGKTA